MSKASRKTEEVLEKEIQEAMIAEDNAASVEEASLQHNVNNFRDFIKYLRSNKKTTLSSHELAVVSVAFKQVEKPGEFYAACDQHFAPVMNLTASDEMEKNKKDGDNYVQTELEKRKTIMKAYMVANGFGSPDTSQDQMVEKDFTHLALARKIKNGLSSVY